MKILLVEDNEVLGEFLKNILSVKRFTVDWIKEGKDVDVYLHQGAYDIVLLDWMLPDTSGIEVIKVIKSKGFNIPIIMLTAKSELQNKVEGLTAGADDYLTKPFEFDELEARMFAVTKRYQRVEPIKQIGNIKFDITAHEFTCMDEVIELSKKEYMLFELLMLNPIVPKEMMLSKVWESDKVVSTNNADALIRLLKKKLISAGANIKIKNIRNVGYKLEEIDV